MSFFKLLYFFFIRLPLLALSTTSTYGAPACPSVRCRAPSWVPPSPASSAFRCSGSDGATASGMSCRASHPRSRHVSDALRRGLADLYRTGVLYQGAESSGLLRANYIENEYILDCLSPQTKPSTPYYRTDGS